MVNKKEKEAFEIEKLRQQIETEKTSLERYVNVLAAYDFADASTATVYFEDMFHDLMRHAFNNIRNSKLTKEQKQKLEGEILFGCFKKMSKIEELKDTLAYYKRLVHWAKNNLTRLPEEKRREIIKKSIEKTELWSAQFNRNSRIYKQIKEFETHNKKPKIRVSKSKKK